MKKLMREMISLLVLCITLGSGLNLLTPAWSIERPSDVSYEIREMSQNPWRVKDQDVQAWFGRVTPLLPRFNKINLAMSLHSLAKLKKARRIHSIPDSFIQSWLKSALGQMNSFNAQELSNSLYAFSGLGIHPTDDFLAAWQSQAIHLIKSFKSQELSNSLYAFSGLGIHPTDDFLAAWQSQAIDLIKSFTSQGLSNSLYAFSGLGIHPTDHFIEVWQTQAIHSIESFKSQELSNSLYAFSVLGIHPEDHFLAVWQNRAIYFIENFKSQGLSNSIYAFSVLGVQPTEHYLEAWKKRALKIIGDFNLIELHQLSLARGVLFARFKILMPSPIIRRLEEASSRFKAQGVRISNAQKAIGKDIRVFYPQDLREEYWIESTATHVDFAVPSSKLIIQFDGPHHFQLRNGQEILSAQDQMLDFILRDEGWKVIRISYRDWERIKNRSKTERLKELKRILDLVQN